MCKFSNNNFYKNFSIIVNSNKLYKKNVRLPFNNCSLNLVNLLLREGLVNSFKVSLLHFKYFIIINLCYFENRPKINNLFYFSKPGRRIYVNITDLRKLCFKFPSSFIIVNSSYGLISGAEAIYFNLGGELLCKLN